MKTEETRIERDDSARGSVKCVAHSSRLLTASHTSRIEQELDHKTG